MSEALRQERRSRRRRRCEACRWPIESGEVYARLSLPPWRDVNTSGHFWTIDAHISPARCHEAAQEQP